MDVSLYFTIPDVSYPKKDADYSFIRKDLIEKFKSRAAIFDEMDNHDVDHEQYAEEIEAWYQSRDNQIPVFPNIDPLKVRTVVRFDISITTDVFNAVEKDSENAYQLIIDLLESDTKFVTAHYSDNEYTSFNLSPKEEDSL